MNTDKLTQGLTKKILIAMVAGIVLGSTINFFPEAKILDEWLVGGIFHVGGKIFVASLKMLVVPLVFVSLVCGTAAMDDVKKLGRIGGKTLLLYLFTTAVAISLALLLASIFQPGLGFEMALPENFQAVIPPPLSDTLINIFPTNPISSLAQGNMLQIIVFALLFGFALTIAGESGKRVIKLFADLNEIIMKLVLILMWIAPYGVFCLLSKTFAEQGFGAILPLAKYFFLVIFILLVHGCVTYPLMLKVLAGLNPIQFLRKFKEVLVFAFSTASSNATLPVTLEVVEHKLGVKNEIASFAIPLGATINMDGTAIMQGVATVFIAQATGIDIGLSGYLMVIVTATLASIGTAGVPGVGLITLAMVLKQVGLPVEAIAIILGIDRLLDMLRTAVNVTGDAAMSCIVAKSENALDQKIFNSN